MVRRVARKEPKTTAPAAVVQKYRPLPCKIQASASQNAANAQSTLTIPRRVRHQPRSLGKANKANQDVGSGRENLKNLTSIRLVEIGLAAILIDSH